MVRLFLSGTVRALPLSIRRQKQISMTDDIVTWELWQHPASVVSKLSC